LPWDLNIDSSFGAFRDLWWALRCNKVVIREPFGGVLLYDWQHRRSTTAGLGLPFQRRSKGVAGACEVAGRVGSTRLWGEQVKRILGLFGEVVFVS
jgi:hypothetical protein